MIPGQNLVKSRDLSILIFRGGEKYTVPCPPLAGEVRLQSASSLIR